MNPQTQIINNALSAGKLKHYRKFGRVTARPAAHRERVRTVIDGVEETVNTAGPGDVVVTGPKGEQYIIDGKKFSTRYRRVRKTDAGDVEYEAIGECWAVQYTGPAFQFNAPWGEAMRIEPGDYMCTTAVGSTDIYRIERGVFEQTYRAV